MAIASLYLVENIPSSVRVLCGPKFADEIKRLEGMTLAERIAEREGSKQS